MTLGALHDTLLPERICELHIHSNESSVSLEA